MNTRTTSRRLASFFMALAMIVSLFSEITFAPVTAYAATEISYQEGSWDATSKSVKFETKTATNNLVDLENSTTDWTTGKWYVVPTGGVTISDRITVTGTVNLILTDGATLTAEKGITVANSNTLNIFAQSEGTGTLNATAYYEQDWYNMPPSTKSCAAIGGYYDSSSEKTEDMSCGAVNIYGGNINANKVDDGHLAAGIGGAGANGNGGNITIYGGTVKAYGSGGAGIGAGLEASTDERGGTGGTVTIYGGDITAIGDSIAGGIASTATKTEPTVSIYGGTVTANGGNGGGPYPAGHGIGKGGHQGGVSYSEGTIVLGENVKLYGSSNNSDWSELESPFTTRQQYMKAETTTAPTTNVESVELNKTSTTILVGASETLTATVKPDGATDKTVTWSSDDTSVATVNNGVVTGVSQGTTKIVVTATNGTIGDADDYTAYCTVTVNAVDVTGVTLNKNATTIMVGADETLTATVDPNNATDGTVTWASDNTSVATVDSNGKVSAIAAGTANITVTATNGTTDTSDDKTATCTVTVHAHNYTVTVNNFTATVSCTSDCPDNKTYTVTLNVSNKDYDGTPLTATVDKSSDLPSTVTVGTVNYVGRDGTTYNSSTTAPTNVGKYTASVTVADKKITKDFEINALEPISYVSSITYNPTTKTVTIEITTIRQYIVITSETKTWANNWYVVKGNVTINGPVRYGAGVKVLLCDGATLTIRGGLVKNGSDLTIYGQEGQTGVLEMQGADNAAVIDGDNITINGGKLKLTPGTDGTLFSNDSSIMFNNGVDIIAKDSSGNDVTIQNGQQYTGSELNNSVSELGSSTKIATYTITYDLAGGTVATANPTTYTAETETFTLNTPTRSGYTFKGWTGTDLESATMTVTIEKGSTGNRNYVATWQSNYVPPTYTYYTVSFNTNGGSNVSSQSVRSGNKASKPTDPTKDGYTFDGWYSDSGLTTAFDFNTAITKNTTLYAKWNENGGGTPVVTTYTITYDLDGGVVATANPTSYTADTEDFTLTNPTKEGYTFKGWTGTDLTEATTTVTIVKGSTGNRSYKATWQKNSGGGETPVVTTYTITYDLDGGTVETANPTSYTANTENFTLNNPTKDGYTFKGWTGTGLSEATVTVTIEKGSTGNRSYKATWESNGSTPIPPTNREHPTLYLKANVVDNAKKKMSAVTLSWKTVKGVSSFEVYGAPVEQKDQLVKVATLKKNKLSYKMTKLEYGKEYVYLVKAIKSDGSVLQESLEVYFVTGLTNESNAKSITAKNVKVRMGETVQVQAKANPKEKNKTVFGEKYTKLYRYFSSNPAIAEVNEDGVVTAKAVGKVTIFVYAPNGVLKKVTANCTSPLMFLKATVTENTKKHTSKVVLNWSAVGGATSYNIYGAPYGVALEKVATVKSNKKSYTISNLEWGKEYGYVVQAVKSDGTEFLESTFVHFVAGSDTQTNAKQVKAGNKTITVGSTYQITPTMVAQNKKKTAITGYTYFSLQPNVATVSDDGTVTAIAKGKATIYVFAPNGVRKAITVTVK